MWDLFKFFYEFTFKANISISKKINKNFLINKRLVEVRGVFVELFKNNPAKVRNFKTLCYENHSSIYNLKFRFIFEILYS